LKHGNSGKSLFVKSLTTKKYQNHSFIVQRRINLRSRKYINSQSSKTISSSNKNCPTVAKSISRDGRFEPLGSKAQSPLEAHRDTIIGIVAEHPDWTLWQYCEEVAAKTDVSVTTGSMCRFLQRHNITLKKRPIVANG